MTLLLLYIIMSAVAIFYRIEFSITITLKTFLVGTWIDHLTRCHLGASRRHYSLSSGRRQSGIHFQSSSCPMFQTIMNLFE